MNRRNKMNRVLPLIETQLQDYKNKVREIDSFYKNMEMSEKTVDIYNGYIRDRVKLLGSISSLEQFRFKWCEMNI